MAKSAANEMNPSGPSVGQIPVGPSPAGQSAAGQSNTAHIPASRQIHIEDANADVTYANFYRVTGTPEEVVLDFGLNAEPLGQAHSTIRVDQRIVTNYFTAKRLLTSLAMTIKRHEDVFGPLEVDVQKRIGANPTQGAK